MEGDEPRLAAAMDGRACVTEVMTTDSGIRYEVHTSEGRNALMRALVIPPERFDRIFYARLEVPPMFERELSPVIAAMNSSGVEEMARTHLDMIQGRMERARTLRDALNCIYCSHVGESLNRAWYKWRNIFLDEAAIVFLVRQQTVAYEKLLCHGNQIDRQYLIDKFIADRLISPCMVKRLTVNNVLCYLLRIVTHAAWAGHRDVVKVATTSLAKYSTDNFNLSSLAGWFIRMAVHVAAMHDAFIAPMVMKPAAHDVEMLATLLECIAPLSSLSNILMKYICFGSGLNSKTSLGWRICGMRARTWLTFADYTYSCLSRRDTCGDNQVMAMCIVMMMTIHTLVLGSTECINCAVEWLRDCRYYPLLACPWNHAHAIWASPLAAAFMLMHSSDSADSDYANERERDFENPSIRLLWDAWLPYRRVYSDSFRDVQKVPRHLHDLFLRLMNEGEPFTTCNAIVSVYDYSHSGTAVVDMMLSSQSAKCSWPRWFSKVEVQLNSTATFLDLCGFCPLDKDDVDIMTYQLVGHPRYTAIKNARIPVSYRQLYDALDEYTHSPDYGRWTTRKHWRLFRSYTEYVEAILLSFARAYPDMPPELIQIIVSIGVTEMDKSRWHCI